MFFIRCGAAIAWVLVVLGVLRTATGLFVAFGPTDIEMPAAVVRYLSEANAADPLNEGLLLFTAGIVIGLLVQIAKGVKFD